MTWFILGLVLSIVAIAYGVYASRDGKQAKFREHWSLRWLELLAAAALLVLGVWLMVKGGHALHVFAYAVAWYILAFVLAALSGIGMLIWAIKNRSSRGARAGIAALVVYLVALFCAGGLLLSTLGGHNSAAADENPLAVDLSKVPANYCPDLVTSHGGKLQTLSDGTKIPQFTLGVTHPVATNDPNVVKKLWSDGTNIPLNPQKLDAEQAVVCSDPAEAAMVMNGLGPVVVANGTVFQANASWMVAQGDAKTAINSWASNCVNGNDNTKATCAKVMSATAYLLGYFKDLGVIKDKAEWYYSAPGPTVDGVPAFMLNKASYSGYFVEFQYATKAGDHCAKFGFNVGKDSANGGDQRLVGLTCVPPTPKPSSSSSKPGPSQSNTCTDKCGSGGGCGDQCGGNSPTPSPSSTPSPSGSACPCTGPSATQSAAPAPATSRPVSTVTPKAPPTSSKPIVTGTPSPADTGTHSSPITTPTGGPFG